jgi:hypothetical protein
MARIEAKPSAAARARLTRADAAAAVIADGLTQSFIGRRIFGTGLSGRDPVNDERAFPIHCPLLSFPKKGAACMPLSKARSAE